MRHKQQRSAAAKLRAYDRPHPSRTSSIRHWHLEQIGSDDPAVAMVHIEVTANGQVNCKGLGLDVVHATIILEELDAARAKLAEYIAGQQSSSGKVIPLFRAA